MKQQNTVLVRKVEIDGEDWPLAQPEEIELELSAIDTGGGFHDPILDFSYALSVRGNGVDLEEKIHRITLHLQDPSEEENRIAFTYDGKLKRVDDHHIEGMGRLKEGRMSRDIMKFVMRSVR